MLLAVMVGLAASASAAGEADSEADSEINLPGVVHLASYQATAFSYHDMGTLIWLAGPDGILRLEIRRAADGHHGANLLQPLLEQRGQGWTAILAGKNDDTLNAWGAEWRHPPQGLARAAQLVTTTLESGPEASTKTPGPWRAGAQSRETTKYEVPSLVKTRESAPSHSVWHSEAAARGLGRGGGQDLLVLSWEPTVPGQSPVLKVTATRSPGNLELTVLTARDVIYAMPEAFVPLWPLAQLVTVLPR